VLQVIPPLCAQAVLLNQVPFGQFPSLHRPWRTTALVRKLLRYYETVRLPMVVHRHRASFRLKFLRLKQLNLCWDGKLLKNRSAAFCLHHDGVE